MEDEDTKESLRFDFGPSVGKVFWDACKEVPAVRPTEPVKPGEKILYYRLTSTL